jgi:C-terminal processing protease CtpA/Prc
MFSDAASKTLYFKYNICKEMEDESVQAFTERLLHAMRENAPEKLVIDMRNNTGGNSTLLDPFIDSLAKCDLINQHYRIFVIIGRDTFSSALLNVFSLRNKTQAILVGEPTGGKPNCYGEVLRIRLEQSGLRISYSTKYYHLIEDDLMPSLYPDVQKEYAIQDYIGLSDPCMEYILLS